MTDHDAAADSPLGRGWGWVLPSIFRRRRVPPQPLPSGASADALRHRCYQSSLIHYLILLIIRPDLRGQPRRFRAGRAAQIGSRRKRRKRNY